MLALALLLHSAGAGAARFDRPLLRFLIEVDNPGPRPVRVERVGVKAEPKTGSFTCASESPAAAPLADYVVEFHVSTPVTWQAALPPLTVPSGDSRTFTVSLYPHDLGACGNWSVSLRVVVALSDGRDIQTDPVMLSTRHVQEYYGRRPAREELEAALRHRDPRVRRSAVERLGRLDLPAKDLERALELRLTDDDASTVRATAAGVAAAAGLGGLAPLVARRLDSAAEVSEARAFCNALGELGRPEVADALARAIANEKLDVYGPAGRALDRLACPAAAAAVRPLLSQLAEGAVAHARAGLKLRLLEAVRLVVAYRDQESVPAVLGLLRAKSTSPVVGRAIADTLATAEAESGPRDPFVRAILPALESWRRARGTDR